MTVRAVFCAVGLLATAGALSGACGGIAVIDAGSNDGGGGAGAATSTGGSSTIGTGASGGAITTTVGPGVGGSGGGPGPCGVDCSIIQTPQCQLAVCNVSTKQCEVVNDDNGVACDDGLFCTVDDACSNGACTGGTTNDCNLPAPQCNVISCNESSQTCSATPANNGTPCTNPNLCIQGSTCGNGQCVGGILDDCFFVPTPDCMIAECNPNNGMCELKPGPNGSPCIDPNDLCTDNKTCVGGQCQGGTPKDCSHLNQGCLAGQCMVNNGQCVQQPITACVNADSCCPSGCTTLNDSDCNNNAIVRPAIERGWWSGAGDHTSANDNTYTGRTSQQNYNSYFIFDLSGITANSIVSAELHLEVESFWGNDPSEQVSLWDVSTPSTTLEADGNGNVPVFNDLMAGNSYASATVLQADVTTVKVFTLSSQARTDILNALGGDFSIGVHVDTITSVMGDEGVRWSAFTEVRVHELHLQVN